MTNKAIKINKIIGANIKYQRNEIGLTQDQLAKRLKLSRPSVVQIENGRQGLPVHSLITVSNVLEVTVSRLLKGTGEYGD